MSKSDTKSDGMISEWDVVRVIEEIKTRKWRQDVGELLEREPELAMVVAHRMQKIWPLIDRPEISLEDKQRLERELQRLLWVPMVLLDHAHRRLWDQFLPSDGDAPTAGSTQNGGGE